MPTYKTTTNPPGPIEVDYLISLLPPHFAHRAPSPSSLASPSTPPSPQVPQVRKDAMHTCHPDLAALHRICTSLGLAPDAQAEVEQEAEQVARMVADAINAEENKQLGYTLDSTTDSGFWKVVSAAQRVRDRVNGGREGELGIDKGPVEEMDSGEKGEEGEDGQSGQDRVGGDLRDGSQDEEMGEAGVEEQQVLGGAAWKGSRIIVRSFRYNDQR